MADGTTTGTVGLTLSVSQYDDRDTYRYTTGGSLR